MKNFLLFMGLVIVVLGLIAGLTVSTVLLVKNRDRQASEALAVTPLPTLAPTSQPPSALEELRSFRFVAEIATGVGPDRRVSGFVRGWFEAPSNTRWEVGSTATASAEATAIVLMTEDGLWTYMPSTKTYSFQPISVSIYKGQPFPLRSSQLVGSILPVSTADDSALRSAPSAELLGRSIALIDLRTAGGGTQRLSVDVKNRLVLRDVVVGDPTAGSYEATIVELSLNQDVDDAAFDFVAPPGSRQVNAGPLAQSNPGPLFPTYLPPGYQIRKSDTSAVATQFQLDDKVYADRAGNAFTLRQEFRDGERWTLPDGERTAVGRYEGRIRQDGKAIVLSWIVDKIKVTLASSSLPIEELLRIAQSMK